MDAFEREGYYRDQEASTVHASNDRDAYGLSYGEYVFDYNLVVSYIVLGYVHCTDLCRALWCAHCQSDLCRALWCAHCQSDLCRALWCAHCQSDLCRALWCAHCQSDLCQALWYAHCQSDLCRALWCAHCQSDLCRALWCAHCQSDLCRALWCACCQSDQERISRSPARCCAMSPIRRLAVRVLQVWCVLCHVTYPATCCASLAGVVCVVPCHLSGDLLCESCRCGVCCAMSPIRRLAVRVLQVWCVLCHVSWVESVYDTFVSNLPLYSHGKTQSFIKRKKQKARRKLKCRTFGMMRCKTMQWQEWTS